MRRRGEDEGRVMEGGGGRGLYFSSVFVLAPCASLFWNEILHCCFVDWS